MHHNHVLLSQEVSSGVLQASHHCQAGSGPSLNTEPLDGQDAVPPLSNGVSGSAACSDMASEIPDMQPHEKVTAQSEQHIKH